MIDDDDIDGLAAEYVLGSLDHSERKAVDARRRLRDVKLHEAIEAWERRLGTLSDRLPGVVPPADLYPRILARIERTQPLHRFAAIIPRSRVRRRRIVAAGIALAACLLLALGWVIYFASDAPAMLVAQLHRATGASTADEGQLPAFAATIDQNSRTLTIRPIAVRPVSGKNYALWLVQKDGATPSLLGSISASSPTTLPWQTGRPLGEFVNSRLVISLEPDGRPAKSGPTVPIAFAGALVSTDSIHR